MKILRYTPLAFAAILLTSCLDTEPMGNLITESQKAATVEDNPARLEASVTAVTANFSTYMTINSRHTDYGYGTIMLHLESRGVDMAQDNTGYNWYSFSMTYDNIDYTYSDHLNIWCTLYNQIYTANAVAATVDIETEDETLMGYLAQALAIRAYDYFKLVQIYQFSYGNIDPSTALGVPIITEENKDDAAANGCPRATVQEVYDQILSDLNNAITLLQNSGYKRTDKRYVDESVVRAIRAQVYLVMKNYSAALEDANYVIENSGASPYTYAEVSEPTFIDINDDAWLWGIYIAETDDVVSSGIVNWPSHMGSFNYGYASVGAWRRVNKKLYESIPSTDIRKGWFLDGDCLSANLSDAQQQYVFDYDLPAYCQVKFAPYGGELYTSTNACDIPLIRIEEIILLKAECQAMSGSPADGAATLQSFVSTYRNPSYSFSGSSDSAVQEEVFQQKRMEFWGEGVIWFDYLRLNKDFDRRGGGFDANYCYNIPAGDNALIWRLPYSEVQYNSQISESDNNPVATHPVAVDDE